MKMPVDTDVLLKGEIIAEDFKERAVNKELARLFGASPILRDLTELGPFWGLPFIIANYVAERKIRKPRPLQYFHDRLVEANATQWGDIVDTREFFDSLCETGLEITESVGYDFKRHQKIGAAHVFYSMHGYSDMIGNFED